MQTNQLKLDMIQRIIENDLMTVLFHYYLPTSPDTHEVMLYLRDMQKDVLDGILKVSKHEVKAILRWIREQFRYNVDYMEIVPTMLQDKYNLIVRFGPYVKLSVIDQIKEILESCPNIQYVFISDTLEPSPNGEAV